MNQNHVDIHGLYNVKPCVGGMPSGNDGPIITAYAELLFLPVDREKLSRYYLKLSKRNNIPRQRLPGIDTPPPSRDTMLGLVAIGLLDPRFIIQNKFSFCPVNLPKIYPLKTIASFILALGEHRNFLWSKELIHAYPLMFSIPLQDRAFYYRQAKQPVPFIYQTIEFIDRKIKPRSDSSALIRFLKYGIRPDIFVFERYFGMNHPITMAARKIHRYP